MQTHHAIAQRLRAPHPSSVLRRTFAAVAQTVLDLASNLKAREEGALTAHAPLLLQPPATLRVLLADDCSINQLLTRAVLARWGIAPTIASNGREAVQAITTGQLDIVLMDIEMPVLDGFEATAIIRAHELSCKLPAVPVVAYSNSERASDLSLLAGFGFNDVLTKPCGMDAMSECLHRWCSDKFVESGLARTQARHILQASD